MVNGIGANHEYLVANTGLSSDNVQGKISKSKQVVTDNFESNSAVKTVAGNTTDPDVMRNTLLILPPLAIINKFIDDKMAGGSSSSLLAKLAGLGDKISNTLGLDKVLSKENGSKISDLISQNRFTKYFTKNYKANPKLSIAKGSSLKEKYLQELTSALKGLASSEATKESIKNVESSLSKNTLEVMEKLVQGGKESASISTEKLLSAADDLVANGISSFREGGLIPKTTNISGISNKLKAVDMQMGKTVLGNFFAKGFLKSKDAITFGGGLLGLGFTANSIIQAIKAAKEAPKGEKKATFMHVLSEHYVGLLLFQPSVNFLYKAGGNKYRGMTVEARKALADLIKTTNANQSLTKEGYKIAKMQQKLLLKGVDKAKVAELAGKSLDEAKGLFQSLKNSGAKLKFWEKPLKSLATVLNTGLDTIKNPSSSVLSKAGNKIKGFAGGLGRFLIIFMVLQPLLQKPVTKLCHKIFGEPKSYLEKQKATEAKNNAQNNTVSADSEKANANETNLLKLFSPEKKTASSNNQVNPQIDAKAQVQNPIPAEKTQAQQTQAASGIASSQPLTPQKTTEQIPFLNLFNKDKGDKKYSGYIPSIEVDYSNQTNNDKELEQYVDQFIAAKDKELQAFTK